MRSPVFNNFLSPPSLDTEYKNQTRHVEPIDANTFLITDIIGFTFHFSPFPLKDDESQ